MTVIPAVARSLHRARLDGTLVAPEPLELDDACAIADHGLHLARSEGERVIGYKIGLTADRAREAFGHDAPVAGYLLESRLHPDGALIPTATLNAPHAETEIAFLIGADLPADATEEDLAAATRAVAPALEIIDSRWQGGASTLPLLLADNANAAAAVLGAPVPLPNDLAAARSVLRIGAQQHQGQAEVVLGDPLRAVAWLARHLAARGSMLRAGDVVLSGSLNVPAPLGAATEVSAEIDGLGRVQARFAVSAGQDD